MCRFYFEKKVTFFRLVLLQSDSAKSQNHSRQAETAAMTETRNVGVVF